MNLQIKPTSSRDIPAIIELMREFASYENLSQYLEITGEKLNEALFGRNGFVEGLMAFDGETPVGYALFFPYFSSFRGQRSLYLEDIYITERYRNSGLGEKMLRHIARIARRQGAVRIDFQVLKWNTPAINFYLKHGAVMDEEERHFKFTDQAFERLASD
ncbi:MAG: GNAT family N-acetyltransferase [Pyrinomonadaceae bacterium]